MKNIENLLKHLDLEQLEENLYRGESRDVGSPYVFGGQVLAQALHAAAKTVEGNRFAHSLHAYFILPGDHTRPIIYEVDRIRDGRSFTTRRVVAIQKGRAIFNFSASFQIEESGRSHQLAMPDVPGPEELRDQSELAKSVAATAPAKLQRIFLLDRPIDFRPVEIINPLNPEEHDPMRHVWIRAKGRMGDALIDHQTVLAYASDYGLLTTAMLPHRLSFIDPKLQLASLDHAMWFHRSFRIDEWILYASDSPSASNSRGFARGSFFTRDGILIASVAQEGLIRLRE